MNSTVKKTNSRLALAQTKKKKNKQTPQSPAQLTRKPGGFVSIKNVVYLALTLHIHFPQEPSGADWLIKDQILILIAS